MKNPLFDNFATLQEQSDTYALFIGEMMKPGANDKVIIQELEEQNEAIMNECDILQVKHDKLERRRNTLLKNNEEIAVTNDKLTTLVDELKQQIQCNFLDIKRSSEDAQKWFNWTMRFALLSGMTTFMMILLCLD